MHIIRFVFAQVACTSFSKQLSYLAANFPPFTFITTREKLKIIYLLIFTLFKDNKKTIRALEAFLFLYSPAITYNEAVVLVYNLVYGILTASS